MKITRKFYWYGDRKWFVFCCGEQLVAVSEGDLSQEAA